MIPQFVQTLWRGNGEFSKSKYADLWENAVENLFLESNIWDTKQKMIKGTRKHETYTFSWSMCLRYLCPLALVAQCW